MRASLTSGLLAAILLVPAGSALAATTAGSTSLLAGYDVSASINYAAGTMAVKSTASVTNNTAGPVGQFVFNLAPLRVGHAVVSSVSVGNQAVRIVINDQSVLVGLPYPLLAGAATSVTIIYSAVFSTTLADKNWLFAKQNGTLTAYRWIPWLSELVPFNRPNFGSPFVTGISPRVSVVLLSDVPLRYGTSGQQSSASADGRTKTFVATNVRDFNFAADPQYAQLVGWSGTTRIIVLSRTLSASKLLYWAQQALSDYSARVGPYVYPTLTVAETPTGTSMESPAMVWITADSAGSYLGYRIAHEVAHQWFYAMIGSNQATEPFADEAVADFMARRLLGNFRSSTCSSQRLDGTIWDYTAACYYEVIYIQGGDYINAYRHAVGSSLFWTGIRSYYKRYLYRMGGTRQLWDTLDAATGYTAGHADRFPTLY